jgi:hypothetical protein
MIEMAEQQGTGKHPHKSTEEPYPHNEAPSTSGKSASERGKGQQAQSESGGNRQQGGSQSESDDLKEREYRDEQGNIHHHTRTYMEQHGKE